MIKMEGWQPQEFNRNIVEKKCDPDIFEMVLSGAKTVDIRLADFEVEKGTVLLLKEFDRNTREYSGREIRKIIGNNYIIRPTEWFSPEDIDEKGLLVMELRKYSESHEEFLKIWNRERETEFEMRKNFPGEWVLYKDNLNRDFLGVVAHSKDKKYIDNLEDELSKTAHKHFEETGERPDEYLHRFFAKPFEEDRIIERLAIDEEELK